MNYKILKMKFPHGIHLGQGMLTDGEKIFYADTLFSALCHEALNMPGGIEKLYQMFSTEALKISDALPFVGDTLYLPKPYLTIRSTEDEGNSKKKKAFKKLEYVPLELMDDYIKGNLDVLVENEKFASFGKYEMRTSASIERDDDAKPYQYGVFHYGKGCGLYVVLGYENEADYIYFLEVINSLSYSGIGGRRSSGLGVFELELMDCPKSFMERLIKNNDGEHFISQSGKKYQTISSISISLPEESEMEVIEGSSYAVIKRSGFVASVSYSEEFRKKKDFYALSAGSCVSKMYKGDIYDVSEGGLHPVYRYAKPLFIGVC